MRRILFVSNLYPDESAPNRGRDNARLLQQLAENAEIEVWALRPVLPHQLQRRFRPRKEDPIRNVKYLNVPYLPKVGSLGNHYFVKWTVAREMDRRLPGDEWAKASGTDLLCAWLFPDACGVAMAWHKSGFPARSMGFIAQGSDVHQYLQSPRRRDAILRAVARASYVVTRSRDLRERLIAAGASADTIHTVYNGVDTSIFHPRERGSVRAELRLDENEVVILFVGNLLPVKDPILLLESFHRFVQRGEGRASTLVFA